MRTFDMKKAVIALIVALAAVSSFAQTQANTDLSDNIIVYRLFPTENMWTFIKLNTRTGQTWQVQYDVNGGSRGVVSLNPWPLVSEEKRINGRFTLYPTQNMWTFILLDQIDGQTWQVQWSMESENRGIIPIE